MDGEEKYLAENRRIGEVGRTFAAQIGSDTVQSFGQHLQTDFGGVGADVRGDDDVRQAGELIADLRLKLEDVETGATQFARLECVDKVRFANDRTACAVDEVGAVLHLGEGFLVKHVVGRLEIGAVNGDDIGVVQNFVKGHIARTDFRFHLGGCAEFIIIDDIHSECFGFFGSRFADPAKSNDAESLAKAAHIPIKEDRFRANFGFAEIPIEHDNAAGDREHQSDGKLAGRFHDVDRRVDDGDAPLGGILPIDVVVADAVVKMCIRDRDRWPLVMTTGRPGR